MQITDSYLALQNCRFTNTFTQVLRGYARLTGTNTVQGQPLSILRETFQAIQPLFVDRRPRFECATAGGISLTGGSFLLGPETGSREIFTRWMWKEDYCRGQSSHSPATQTT
jgi:hypothetical protein